MLVSKHVERPRVVPLCLVEAFPSVRRGGLRSRAPRPPRSSGGSIGLRATSRESRHACSRCQATISTNSSALPGQDRHPVGEADVELCTSALRDLSVRDVPHQDVLERVLVLARDRRDLAVQDEVATLERRRGPRGDRVELRPSSAPRCATAPAQKTAPTTAALCASCLSPPSSRSSRELIRPWTLVGTGSSPISSLRQRSSVDEARGRAASAPSPRGRAGFRPRSRSAPREGRLGERGVAEQVGRAARPPVRHRACRARSCAAGRPCRGSRATSCRARAGSSRRSQQPRTLCRRARDVRDQVEQRRLGPVEVFEDERRRAARTRAAAARGGSPSAARPARSRAVA